MNTYHYHYGGEDYQRLQRSNAYLKDFEATLDAASNIVELADALYANTSIENVRANIHDSFAGTRLPSEVLVFFEALGSRPNLKRIFLGTFRYPQQAHLQVQPLSLSLIQASQLTFLEVCGLELTGTSSDFTTLGASLQNHLSLREVKIYNCRLPDEQQEETLLDPLLRSLGSIRSLQRIVMNAPVRHALGGLTSEALGVLCSGHLQAIGLLGFSFDESHVKSFCTALTNNSSLKELCLGKVQLGTKGDLAVARLLRSNSSALEYLDMQLEANESPLQMAAALVENTRLKHLFVHGSITPISQQAFAEAIPLNYGMESLELMDGSPYMVAIRFYLRMNGIIARAGLTSKARSQSQQRWREVLITQRDDLSAIFYLLSRNPLVCYNE